MSADDILRVVQGMSDAKGVRKVTITGGEPLEQDQRELALLMGELMDHGYHITVETAGTQNTLKFRADHEDLLSNRRFGQLTFIVDYKLPSSKFVGSMDIADHFSHLKRGDVVKFVISDEYDFAEATRVAQILDASWPFRGKMFFSPNHDEVHPHQLLEWMRDAKMQDLDVGLNLQLHKYIFPDDVRDEENTGVDFTKRTLGRDAYLDKIRESKDA